MADGSGAAVSSGERCFGLVIHVDAWEHGRARGCVRRLREVKSRSFESLDQLLLELEAALCRESLVATDTVRARWRASAGWPAGRRTGHSRKPCRPVRTQDTYYILIYSQQHFTLQGTVQAAGRRGQAVPFRSGWELLCLLRCALEAGEETGRKSAS